jgi:seryl-tRNA(Sec) selenium transferase
MIAVRELSDIDRIEREEAASAVSDAPWAVLVLGLNLALANEIVVEAGSDIGTVGPPFTEHSARQAAVLLNECFDRGETVNELAIHAVVLHHGVTADETAGA